MSTLPLNQQLLQISQIQNMYVPSEGPKAIPVNLDYTGGSASPLVYTLDLQNFQSLGNLQMVQTLYVDCSASSNDLTMTMSSGQVIVAKAGTQGYYAVLCPNPVKIAFSSATSSVVIPVFLINTALPGVVWDAS